MAKRKQNLNGLYISPRLRDSLTPIGRCALTSANSALKISTGSSL